MSYYLLKDHKLSFFYSHCEINIIKSKTDVLRDAVIGRTGNDTCPVKLLERYLLQAKINPLSEEYIFRSVHVSHQAVYKLLPSCKPVSYSTINEAFKKKLKILGYDGKKFGLHSFRSGGATVSALNKTVDRLWQRHGRWKSVAAKDGYVKDSSKDRLSVSLNLDI